MKFIDKYFNRIVTIFLFLIFAQQCSNSHTLSGIEKKQRIESIRLDSISTRSEIARSLKIEGLKSEMRMIQSTDRKILDVNRQSEIDRELKRLESTK
jgi:hypothetical protein